MLEKLVIASINPQVCYLIIEISYADPLLIIKLIVLGIEFKVFGGIKFASNSIAKPEKTRPSQYVLKHSKN